jgi:large subunit ribosomal protein L29
MKIQQLRELSLQQLQSELASLFKKEATLRLVMRSGQQERFNTAQVQQVRRTIARVKTLLREKQISGETAS